MKIFKTAFFLATFSFCTPILAQEKQDSIITKEYKNELLMKGQTGKVYFLMKENEKTFVYIKWPKGFSTVGTLINSSENGHWYLFGKNNILRKDVFYSNGKANQITEFDEQGKQIRKTNFSADF